MSEKRTSDGLIYLASPYSHDDTQIRDGRFREVCKWAARFMRAGKLIFSPIAHTHPIAMAGELPTGWAFWQKYDHAQLDAASEMWVLMLDGWDKSKGVQGEIEYMKVKGKPIRYIDPICEPTDDRFPSPEFFRDTLTATPTPPQPGERWTDEELTVIAQLAFWQELSTHQVFRQALRLYQLHIERTKAGETCVWSGDAQNATLEKRLAEAEAFLKLFRSYVDARENHPMVAGEMYRELLKAAGLIKDTQPTEAKHELP